MTTERGHERAGWVSFAEVKARIALADVLARYGLLAGLRPSGQELVGRCPFHAEREGSFRASLVKNAFRCFGCGRQGNVLDFVALREGVDVRQAALLLQAWFLGPAEPRPAPERPPARRPLAPENRPLRFALADLDPAHPYLAARGLTPATVEHFGLGYCAQGLLAGRIAIPIHDEQGRLVAYAGRWPGDPPAGQPRYRFPAGFRKSQVVFNLHRADRAAQLAKEKGVIIAEGFFDCFKIHQAGYPNVYALMGSTLSRRQEELLAAALGPAGQVTLWFDADAAGRRCLADCSARLAGAALVRAVELGQEGVQPDQLATAEIREILG